MFSNLNDGEEYKNLIDGKWIKSASGNLINIYSPIDKKLVGKIQALTKEEIDSVIKASKKAQRLWQDKTINERAAVLHKAAGLLEENVNELAGILQNEIAKEKNSSINEVKRTADFIRFTADAGKNMEGESIEADNFPGFSKNKISIVTRVPVGVVLAISPFNYPINLSASKLAPALIAGNSVILKPPTQGAISALYLAEIFNAAGLPPGVLNTVTGKGSEIGDYIVTHKDIDFINFTGSTEVGKHIAVIAGMVPMLMELGGKDAAIVLKDADINEASKDIANGAFAYSGQRCTAVKRVIVLNEIADNLVEKIHDKINHMKIGKPQEAADITPLISDEAADYVMQLIDDALKKGATLITGNKRDGNTVYPTLLDHVNEEMRVAWEEPFGPVLPVIRVNSIDEAIKIANKSQYGLQSSVFTKNIDDAFYTASRLEVGTVQINNKTERSPDHFPFLGVKSSGMGTQGIRYSIEAMSRPKVTILNIE